LIVYISDTVSTTLYRFNNLLYNHFVTSDDTKSFVKQ